MLRANDDKSFIVAAIVYVVATLALYGMMFV
jgi:hypothetical protein